MAQLGFLEISGIICPPLLQKSKMFDDRPIGKYLNCDTSSLIPQLSCKFQAFETATLFASLQTLQLETVSIKVSKILETVVYSLVLQV